MSYEQEREKVLDYVRRQGDCRPSAAELIDDDPVCPVWKVTVDSFDPAWEVPPPRFWFVCPEPIMNLYRNDSQSPQPWLPADEQSFESLVDYVKSFHLGIAFRMGFRHDRHADQAVPSVLVS